jgi:hypothetical protein
MSQTILTNPIDRSVLIDQTILKLPKAHWGRFDLTNRFDPTTHSLQIVRSNLTIPRGRSVLIDR